MNISEKVSYIKGLAEGLKLDDATKEGKILNAILDVLSDIAYQVEDIDSDLNDMADVVGDLDDAVLELEDEVYGGEYDEYDDDECGCGCHHHGGEEDDEDLYEITCPKCNNTIIADFDLIAEGGIVCPNCGEPLEFDLSALEEAEDEE
ncbi:MAG: zinc ribbon domain-containing protein [Firmicutes bacterium]|nr:zinc ribbon domain-containing protein [[Eubacterium] siraeum]MCM1487641.1 zinc ribbon domain-containing protein [Bacillota bacterium]